MPIVRVSDLSLSYGPTDLLIDASFTIEKGERICIVGRNGAGKSTLMRLVDGTIKPDHGQLWYEPGLVVSRLEQELPPANELSVEEYVSGGLAEIGEMLSQYKQLSESTDADLSKLERLQHEIEANDGWSYQQRIQQTLSRLSLPAQARMDSLSGGWRRRVALAKALVTQPDLLLLDEPTNHLDIETITWLEDELMSFSGAVLFITHDRALVKRLSTKIFEIDRGRLKSFDHGYEAYLEESAHLQEVEQQQNALFDKKLAQEEVWIRQGIKARRTRNEGRVRALKQLRNERAARKERVGTAKITVTEAVPSGKIIASLKGVGHRFEDKPIFHDVTISIMRGDKVGLLGPNGVGKTTLLRIILGQLEPDQGKVKLGTKLQVAYFDQMRGMLDGDKTIVDIVGQGRESVTINGKDRHVMSYLSDFLFSPERARTPVRVLSGGEANRVQLACLFSQPANVLVLDEPTNDLDAETLELLESLLVEFGGTVLLVSHDREFLDNVVSSTLAFENAGEVNEYVGGYNDWLRQRRSSPSQSEDAKNSGSAEANLAKDSSKEAKNKPKKLSYKLQRELDELPELIEEYEAKVEAFQSEVGAPDLYDQAHDVITMKLQSLAAIEEQLETYINRWIELSD